MAQSLSLQYCICLHNLTFLGSNGGNENYKGGTKYSEGR